MDAAYYRRLARDLMTNAATTDNPKIAERFRQRAREYSLIAEALDDTRPPLPPRQAPQPPAQQQQQVPPKQDEDETTC